MSFIGEDAVQGIAAAVINENAKDAEQKMKCTLHKRADTHIIRPLQSDFDWPDAYNREGI